MAAQRPWWWQWRAMRAMRSRSGTLCFFLFIKTGPQQSKRSVKRTNCDSVKFTEPFTQIHLRACVAGLRPQQLYLLLPNKGHLPNLVPTRKLGTAWCAGGWPHRAPAAGTVMKRMSPSPGDNHLSWVAAWPIPLLRTCRTSDPSAALNNKHHSDQRCCLLPWGHFLGWDSQNTALDVQGHWRKPAEPSQVRNRCAHLSPQSPPEQLPAPHWGSCVDASQLEMVC